MSENNTLYPTMLRFLPLSLTARFISTIPPKARILCTFVELPRDCRPRLLHPGLVRFKYPAEESACVRMRRRKRTLKHVQVHRLVLRKRGLVRESEVDQHLHAEAEEVSGLRSWTTRRRTIAAALSVVGRRRIIFDVVKSPWTTSVWCILANSTPIIRIVPSAWEFSAPRSLSARAKGRTPRDAIFCERI